MMNKRMCRSSVCYPIDGKKKYVKKIASCIMAFVDLEKTYDRVKRKGLWKALFVYGVGDTMLNAVKSIYDGSMVYARANGGLSE